MILVSRRADLMTISVGQPKAISQRRGNYAERILLSLVWKSGEKNEVTL